MKTLILISILSSSVFSNQVIDILNKHRTELLNIEVGMTHESIQNGTEIDFDSSGNIIKKKFKATVKGVVLQANDSLVYRYIQTTKNGITTNEVELEDLDSTTDPNFAGMKFTSIKKVKNTLSAKFSTKIVDPESGAEVSLRGDFSKKLTSPAFCDVTTNTKVKMDLFGTIIETQQSEKNKCAKSLTREEVKSINLSKVTFCDFTQTAGFEYCKEDQDMSFLTNGL